MRWTGRTAAVHGNERPRSIHPKRTAEIDRVYGGSRQTDPDDVSGDVISGDGSAARARKLAGERRRFGTNGGHQDDAGIAANSPVTKTSAEEQRRRRRSGGDLRLDDGDGAPAVFGSGEGADEDGDATATTTAAFPSDGDDWSDGDARLERRRRRQS